jgi:hypothetical protein
MPASPWKSFGQPDSVREYVALLSSLPLKSSWRLPWFFVYTAQVIRQLKESPGLIGYSLLARPLARNFWTLSAWESEALLKGFVRNPPHVRLKVALAAHMRETRFVRWNVKGAELPLRWDDALRRLGLA